MAEARRIISYFELPKKALPPKSIWHSPDKCNEFIEKNLDMNSKGPSFLEFTDTEQEHAD